MIQIVTNPKQWEWKAAEGGTGKEGIQQSVLQSGGIRKEASGFSGLAILGFAFLRKIAGSEEQREICG